MATGKKTTEKSESWPRQNTDFSVVNDNKNEKVTF